MNRSALLFQRIGPLGAIILLHIGFFYALQSGLLRQAASPQHVSPKTVFVSFITPEPPKPLEVPKLAPPRPASKPAPVVKKAVKPPPPPVKKQPSKKAITAPPEPPPAPAPPAPSTPPAPAAEPAPSVPPVAEAAPAAPSPPAAPPRPTAPAPPRLISSGIEYIRAPQPAYPAFSRRMREEGKVVMRVLVNEKGRPEQVEIETSSGHNRLDEAAKKAALRAVFKPHIENGRPIAVFALIPISFQLDS
jgi:protein TonB